MSMYICKVNFNSSTCLLREICVFFVYRQHFCTSTWTWMHLQKNLQVPGMDGRGICGEKTPFEIVLFPCKSDVFLLQTSQLKGSTGQLCSSFPTKTSASRNPLDLTLEEVQQAGWKFHYGFPTEISKPEFLGWLQGHPKGKPKGAPDIPTGEMEKWTSVEILSTSRIFGGLEFFFLLGKNGWILSNSKSFFSDQNHVCVFF